ncbi:hypothetical protein WJX73_000880 [Symbiochloris irregularis]|uniref:Thioredoxin domain-containing protein n=1 Tax=Symbiochloris irregularis TaxID=706552 RepID=A0AAW1NUK8_9CHLO
MEAVVQQAIHDQVLSAARAAEDQLDSQLHALNKLDEDDMEEMRRKRLEQMKIIAKKKQEWMNKGHGEYREIDGEKNFFSEMKGEARLVCHFFRNNWPCKVIDRHLETLAKTHLETKFIRIHAEKSPFLVERLKIWMLPTLALIKNEKTVDYVVGFDDLGGKDDFSTNDLAMRLCAAGVLSEDKMHKPAPAPARNIRQGGQPSKDPDDEDSDFE